MSTFTDRLAILIQADAAGAVREIQRVGDAAERDIGRADNKVDRLGSTFLRTGSIMVGASVVVGAGLFHTAQAADNAEVQHRKLENTLARIPELADANIKAFDDQADAIHRKTVVDDDEVTALQALVGQFNLTQDEVLGLTPLIVDLSRKMGIDLESAGKAVGKTLEGNSGALKRLGIDVDTTRLQTDAYGAVIDALRGKVGGFAESEGKTFQGQLTITKNLLGDLEEGVGVGVIGVFNKALGPVSKLSAAFKDLDPETQKSIGTIATIGTLATGSVGGLLMLSGAVIKMRTAWQNMNAETPRIAALTRTIGGLGATAMVLGTVAAFGPQIADAFGQAPEALSRFANRFAGMSEQMLDQVATLAMASDTVGSTFDEALSQGVPAAERFTAALERQGYNVDDLRKKIATKKDEDARARVENEKYADSTDKSARALQGEEQAAIETKQAIEDKRTAVEASFNSELRYQQSITATQGALDDYNAAALEAIAAGGQNKELNDAASEAYQRLQSATLSQAQAAAEQAKQQFDANTTLEGAAKKAGETEAANAAYRAELARMASTLAPDSPLRVYIEGLITRMDVAAQPRTMKFNVDAADANWTLDELIRKRNDLRDTPVVVSVGITADYSNPLTNAFLQSH